MEKKIPVGSFKWFAFLTRLALYIVIIFASYLLTKSVGLSALFGILVLVLYIFLSAVYYSHVLNKAIKDFVEQYSYDSKLRILEISAESFLFFQDKKHPAIVGLIEEGIYIEAHGFFKVIVPWVNVKKISFEEIRGLNVARLYLINEDKRVSNALYVPWRAEFDKMVIDSNLLQ